MMYLMQTSLNLSEFRESVLGVFLRPVRSSLHTANKGRYIIYRFPISQERTNGGGVGCKLDSALTGFDTKVDGIEVRHCDFFGIVDDIVR
jgi:hypothetical protein